MKKGSLSDGVVYHAGFPNAGEDQRFDSLSLDHVVFKHRASTYLWRLETDVAERGWQAGSIVVVDRALQPRQGDFLVVVSDEEFVIRTWHAGHIVGHDGQPETAENIVLWGVITHVLQEYRTS